MRRLVLAVVVLNPLAFGQAMGDFAAAAAGGAVVGAAGNAVAGAMTNSLGSTAKSLDAAAGEDKKKEKEKEKAAAEARAKAAAEEKERLAKDKAAAKAATAEENQRKASTRPAKASTQAKTDREGAIRPLVNVGPAVAAGHSSPTPVASTKPVPTPKAASVAPPTPAAKATAPVAAAPAKSSEPAKPAAAAKPAEHRSEASTVKNTTGHKDSASTVTAHTKAKAPAAAVAVKAGVKPAETKTSASSSVHAEVKHEAPVAKSTKAAHTEIAPVALPSVGEHSKRKAVASSEVVAHEGVVGAKPHRSTSRKFVASKPAAEEVAKSEARAGETQEQPGFRDAVGWVNSAPEVAPAVAPVFLAFQPTVADVVQANSIAPPPTMTLEILRTFTGGTPREDVLRFGPPASRVTMYDDGHVVEIYSYLSHGVKIGTIQLSDGVVSSVRAN